MERMWKEAAGMLTYMLTYADVCWRMLTYAGGRRPQVC
jgi:hypothetical protein